MQACSECPIPPIPPASASPTHAVDVLTNRRATVWHDLNLIRSVVCDKCSSIQAALATNKWTVSNPQLRGLLPLLQPSWLFSQAPAMNCMAIDQAPSVSRICHAIHCLNLVLSSFFGFFLSPRSHRVASSPGLSAVLWANVLHYLSNIFLSFRV